MLCKPKWKNSTYLKYFCFSIAKLAFSFCFTHDITKFQKSIQFVFQAFGHEPLWKDQQTEGSNKFNSCNMNFNSCLAYPTELSGIKETLITDDIQTLQIMVFFSSIAICSITLIEPNIYMAWVLLQIRGCTSYRQF